MTTVYVVSECIREPWQQLNAEPCRETVLAIYSNETAARTHVASSNEIRSNPKLRKGQFVSIEGYYRWLRISTFEVDSFSMESA